MPVRGEQESDVCEQLRQRFAERLNEGGKCERDDDCACYTVAVDCGGVSDRATVRGLDTLARMYRLARCPLPNGCTPSSCLPVCVQGRCVRSASAAIESVGEPEEQSRRSGVLL